MNDNVTSGMVFDVQRFSVHDGPGIRTTVFMKGCPLNCWWCANPESQSPLPELGFVMSRCNKCNKCIKVCEPGSLTMDAAGNLQIDRTKCNLCGKCVEVCQPKSLTIFGKERTVEDIVSIIKKDVKFYEDSGGVTLSGGESLMQPGFSVAILKQCRDAGIGTCIETSGFARKEDLEKVMSVTDDILYDIKHMDREQHRKYTGKDNQQILANAALVAAKASSVIFRIPLVRGVNDSKENLLATADFLRNLRPDVLLEILPYHRMGMPKWTAVGKPYQLTEVQIFSRAEVEEFIKLFDSFPTVHVSIMQ